MIINPIIIAVNISVTYHGKLSSVSALNELTQERKVQGEMRRQVQEDTLVEETGKPPAFLQRSAPAPAPRAGGDQTRAVARAAEMIAPPPRPTPARIDHTIADRDPRLPPATWGRLGGDDDEELARLGGDIQSRGQ